MNLELFHYESELHKNPSMQHMNINMSACGTHRRFRHMTRCAGTAYLLNCPVHPICVSQGLGPDMINL